MPSAVVALRDAIVSTDAAVTASLQSPKPSAPVRPSGPLRAASKIAETASAVASLHPALAAFQKLFTGGAREDWNSFRDTTLSNLSGKTDKDFTSAEFGSLVTRFVQLRANLAQAGVALPPVTLPQLEHATTVPVWVWPLLGVAALGGIVLWSRSVV